MAKRRRQRAKRGSGSVYWDARNATWMASISLGTRDGKRITRKRRARDEDDAHRLLDGLRRARDAGVDPAKGTVGQYLRSWLETKRGTVRESTWRSYEGHVRLHISPLLGGIPIVRLRPSDVRRLIRDRLDADKDPATVAHIVTTLRIAIGQAVSDRLLLDDPTSGVKLPRVEREPVVPMTPAMALLILDAVKGDHLEALYVLLLGTGMRVGEACSLDWRDVDLDAGTVFIRQGKTRAATRTIPLPSFVVHALRSHRAASPRVGPREPVFLGERVNRTTRAIERLRVDTVSHAFPRLMVRVGLPRMTVHKLRHGTATLLVAMGVPMRIVSEILGHANPSVSANIYAHVSIQSKREAMSGLDEIHTGARQSG